MELLKAAKPDECLKFQWHDVTFLVKPKASANDKFLVDCAGNFEEDGQVTFDRKVLYRLFIKLFVVEWHGVTDPDTKNTVRWSPEALDLLPARPGDDVILQLGAFIGAKTNILKEPEHKHDVKNG